MLAPAIKHASKPVHCQAQLQPRLDLGDTGIRVAGIGKYEEIEVLQISGPRHRFVSCAQPGKDTWHMLVANRHDDRGASLFVERRIAGGAARNGVTVTAKQQQHEPGDGCPEADGYPAEKNRKQNQHRDLEGLSAVIGQYGGHEIGRDVGLRDDQAQEGDAPEGTGGVPLTMWIGRICGHFAFAADCIGEDGYTTVADFTASISVTTCPACGNTDNLSEIRITTERAEEYALECGDCGEVWQL